MKNRLFLPLIFASILISGVLIVYSQAAQAEPDALAWETVAPGIEYQEFHLTEPVDNDVYVARMDRNNPNVTVDSMIAQGRLSGGVEPVSSMYNRYDDSINFWDQSWGKRSDAVVAINGYYFGPDHEPPGVPWRGQIHSGWYAKQFDNNENGSGFVWKLDRTAFIGECVYHTPSAQYVHFIGVTTDTLKIHGVNVPRDEDEPGQLILYTPQYDMDTKTNNDGVEVLVEMTRPTLILPGEFFNAIDWLAPIEDWLNPAPDESQTPTAEAIGVVRQILDGSGSTPIPFDHIVLSATGTPRNYLLQNLQVDMQIGISQAVNHLSDDDCSTPIIGKDWTKAYAGIGGAFYFLEDGLINGFPGNPQATVRDARTAIAYNEDYIFFIVVDQIIFGDDPGDPAEDQVIRPGMNMAELGYFARDTLGADFGIAQDGGGSTTMVVNGEVKNVPNDFDADITVVPCTSPELTNVFYLPLIAGPDQAFLSHDFANPATPTPDASDGGVCYQGTERWVANGMMMVVVSPMLTSTTFTTDMLATTTITANLRLGPGTNYPSLATIPISTTGAIEPHFNGLDGVYAKGFYWWKINFGGGLSGWMSEGVLTTGP